ncbi:MAG: outer membrane protein assembly factor BamE [Acetobacteraceae bacterium]|nr:outer membrane protein assembly factor BamE [Acetobacteraceae bacterium]
MRLAAFCALALLAGCGWLEQRPQVRGNRIDAALLKELTPGTSTRGDATALLGSPTAKATFDDNQWIYIGEMTRPVIARTQSVVNQEVVMLTFNDQGVLQDIKRLDQKDSYPVQVVARATASPGSEASFLQQLLGNIGKFNPGGVGATAAAAGGASIGGANPSADYRSGGLSTY